MVLLELDLDLSRVLNLLVLSLIDWMTRKASTSAAVSGHKSTESKIAAKPILWLSQ